MITLDGTNFGPPGAAKLLEVHIGDKLCRLLESNHSRCSFRRLR